MSVVEVVESDVLVTQEPFVEILTDEVQGPQGIPGTRSLKVGPTQPTFPAGEGGLWIQTGLGADGSGFTFWFEDGK